MSLQIASINSGSNGNCYYIGSKEEAVLIDAGISCRETEKRLRSLDLKMESIKAIFISHEHGDHIYGLETIANRYKIPVFTNFKTGALISKKVPPGLLHRIDHGHTIELETLKIKAFSKFHDAIDPLSFTVTGNDVTIGIFTDMGKACEELKTHFQTCHAAFLESNYDEEMLENGKYPYHLKSRIKSDHGHLSNHQALELFEACRPPFMTHLLLSHLSKENNSPEKALSYFAPHRNNLNIQVASREGASAVFHIQSKEDRSTSKTSKAIQLPLF